jgi:hypothetical protein
VRSGTAALIAMACALMAAAPTAAADQCGVLGGDWNYQDGVCISTLTSVRDAIMTLSVGLPLELTADPAAEGQGPRTCGASTHGVGPADGFHRLFSTALAIIMHLTCGDTWITCA